MSELVDSDKPHGLMTLRTVAMPADTNAAGDIFGGWVLSQMDLAGSITAGHRAQGRTVTVAVDRMKFIRPVKVGDVLCVYTELGRVGRTSIEVHLEAWAMSRGLGARSKVTQATFTFVHVDDAGHPSAVPEEAPTEALY